MNVLTKLWELVDGHKTDIVQVVTIFKASALFVLYVMGYVTEEQIEKLPWIVGIVWAAFTAMTFRDAMRKE